MTHLEVDMSSNHFLWEVKCQLDVEQINQLVDAYGIRFGNDALMPTSGFAEGESAGPFLTISPADDGHGQVLVLGWDTPARDAEATLAKDWLLEGLSDLGDTGAQPEPWPLDS